MKPGVRKFFRLCGYTPASCLSSWNLRSNHSFWPEASIEDSREGAWPDAVFSLRLSVTWRAFCRSFVMATPPGQFIRQYRESLIWESVQLCTDISGWEQAIFEFYGRHFVGGFLGAGDGSERNGSIDLATLMSCRLPAFSLLREPGLSGLKISSRVRVVQ
jgi:hypothetical protein